MHALVKSLVPDEHDGLGEAQLFSHRNPRARHENEAKSSAPALMKSLGILQAFLIAGSLPL